MIATRISLAKASMPGIHRLPLELLVDIFLHVQASRDSNGRREPWYQLLWVCSLWSTLIRGRPVFWRVVEMRHSHFNRNFLETTVVYSGRAPLDVYIDSANTSSVAYAAKLLLPHASRIRVLELSDLPDTQDQSLELLLNQDMPILQKAKLQFKDEHYHGFRTQRHFVWNLRYPALSELHIGRAVSLNSDLPLLPRLRRLELSHCDTNPMTTVEFAHYLSQHRLLEELLLANYRPKLVEISEPMSLPATLRKFSLEDLASYTAPFLSSFYIPPQVDVDIQARDPHNVDQANFSILHALPSTRAAVLPILTCVYAIEVMHIFTAQYTLSGRTPAGHTVRLTVHTSEDSHSFAGLARAFSGAPVVRLIVNNNASAKMDGALWREALEEFPLVEEIVVAHTSYVTAHDARMGLIAALDPRHSETEGPYPLVRDAPLARRLRSLTMPSIDILQEDEQLSQALARSLKSRKKHGFGLQRLTLNLMYHQVPWNEHLAEDDNARRVAVYSQALHALVGQLELKPVNEHYTVYPYPSMIAASESGGVS